MCEPENATDTMTPKITTTRSTLRKMKELEKNTTPLVQILHNVCKAKVIEMLWERLWKEIKKWSYKNEKMMEEDQKLSASTILSYINAPLMASFSGTKDIITKFIVIQYHNGKFYFDKPI